MDPAGSTWVVGTTIKDVALCDFAEQQNPGGLAGWISSTAFAADGPLVAVLPIGGPAMDLAGQMESRIPRVFALDRGNWKPISWAPVPYFKERPSNPISETKAQRDALICSGPKSAVWLAAWNAYRLERVSDSDEPDLSLVVGSGEVEWAKLTETEQQTLTADLKARGLDPKGAVHNYPKSVIRALMCGRDGLIYLIVSTEEGLALDRFSPSMATLERVLLDKIEVSGGPLTAVMTRDEIVFGGRFAEDGLWRIDLEALEAAVWRPVAGAKLNGKPLS